MGGRSTLPFSQSADCPASRAGRCSRWWLCRQPMATAWASLLCPYPLRERPAAKTDGYHARAAGDPFCRWLVGWSVGCRLLLLPLLLVRALAHAPEIRDGWLAVSRCCAASLLLRLLLPLLCRLFLCLRFRAAAASGAAQPPLRPTPVCHRRLCSAPHSSCRAASCPLPPAAPHRLPARPSQRGLLAGGAQVGDDPGDPRAGGGGGPCRVRAEHRLRVCARAPERLAPARGASRWRGVWGSKQVVNTLRVL